MSLASAVFTAKCTTVLRSSNNLLQEFIRHENVSAAELEQVQKARHAAQAKFAFEHTRFYRDYYSAAGLRAADFDDPDVVSALPIVEKSHVRENYADFVSDEATPRNSARSTTGGSTGEPLKLLRDLRFPARALEWRLFRWWGVKPYDDVAIVTRHVKSTSQSRKHSLMWWPSQRIHMDAFDMTPQTVSAFIENWRRVRPNIMIGYVGAIAELASMVQDMELSAAAPTAIGVTAAPLSANQRVLIESVFHTKVYDHYRSSEIPWMAGECTNQSGQHVFSDVRALDIVDPDGHTVARGEVGEAIWTDMTNRVFPLVRYRLGDRTAWLDGECPCGVRLPRIRTVVGRVAEMLYLPDGQSVAGEGLAQIFSATPDAVRHFQIVQRSDYSIDVSYVRGPSSTADAEIHAALAKFRGILHDKVAVTGVEVDHIAHVGGKIRYLVSEVAARGPGQT